VIGLYIFLSIISFLLMKRLFRLFPAAILGAALLLSSCKKEDNATNSPSTTPTAPSGKSASTIDAKVATVWFEQFRTLTKKTPGFTPPVAARAFGYAGVTLYETIVPGTAKYQSLQGQLSDLKGLPTIEAGKEYHWGIVANAAMAEVARNFYPTAPVRQITQNDSLENVMKTNFSKDIAKEITERSIVHGKAMAKAIFEWSKTDGGHAGYGKNFPTDYVVPVGEGYWVPTSAQKIPMQPYWGKNRSFVPGIVEATIPAKMMNFSERAGSPFYEQAAEVYNAVTKRTKEEETIARFWSDDPGEPGTPPGHIVSIANQVIEKEQVKLDKAAETLAKVTIAVSDAFVCCWRTKYIHNLMRPVTYINKHIDKDWKTVLATPPFPEFTSGHSSQTGAAARILSDIYGYNYAFEDRTHSQRTDINGAARKYTSFYEMAQEAALSRLYGGIHYREAIEVGVISGIKISVGVNKLRFSK
jgi:PAP2 superfamily